ncbi:MAG: hypothetical protein ACJ71F_04765 [Nitrososphaeraceae archaeon]
MLQSTGGPGGSGTLTHSGEVDPCLHVGGGGGGGGGSGGGSSGGIGGGSGPVFGDSEAQGSLSKKR